VKQKSAIAVLNKIATDHLAPLYRFGRQFKVRRNKKQAFTYFGMEHTWHDMQTGLLGNHQVDNAALVLAACEILRRDHAVLPMDSIKTGLLKNIWPGRLEVVSKSPFIILDGAHNLTAALRINPHITLIDDVGEAVRHAIQTAAPDEVVCIAGSLYVVGEAKETFEKHPDLIRKSK